MFTVIFVNQRTEHQRKNYQFLFQPLVEAEEMCFCQWFEDGKTIEEAVPDLYRLIKGKKEWRAIVVQMDSLDDYKLQTDDNDNDQPSLVKRYRAKEKNPFDYSECDSRRDPHESDIPIIRLTHILAGYDYSPVQAFTPHFEYYNDALEENCTIPERSLDCFYNIQKHFKTCQFFYSPTDAPKQQNIIYNHTVRAYYKKHSLIQKDSESRILYNPDDLILEFYIEKQSIPKAGSQKRIYRMSLSDFVERGGIFKDSDINVECPKNAAELNPKDLYIECTLARKDTDSLDDDNTSEAPEVFSLSLSEYIELIHIQKHNIYLKPVYRAELADKDLLEKQNEIRDAFRFADNRPTELLLFATRHKAEIDEKKNVHKIWNQSEDKPSGLFWQNNQYPTCCRFLYMDIMNSDNIRFEQDLFHYWLAVLLLAHNNLESSILKAYNLYSIRVDINEKLLFRALNRQMNQLDGAYKALEMALQSPQDYSFSPNESLFVPEPVTIKFDNDKAMEMSQTREIDIFSQGDRYQEQLEFERDNKRISEEQSKTYKVGSKQRVLDNAVHNIRMRAFGFLPQHYLLDDYQVKELEEKKREYERKLIQSGSHSPEAFERIQKTEEEESRKTLEKANQKIEAMQAKAMDASVIKKVAGVAIALVVLGNGTYIVQSAMQKQSTSENLLSFGGALLVTLTIIVCALVCAYFVLRRYQKDFEQSNTQYQNTLGDIQKKDVKHENTFGDFYSDILTYYKLHAIYRGMNFRRENDIASRRRLLEYSRAIHGAIRRDEKWLRLYGFERMPVETAYCDGFSEMPLNNPIFYFEGADEEQTIPLNTTGDLSSVYPFIEHVWIERDYLSDDVLEDDIYAREVADE